MSDQSPFSSSPFSAEGSPFAPQGSPFTQDDPDIVTANVVTATPVASRVRKPWYRRTAFWVVLGISLFSAFMIAAIAIGLAWWTAWESEDITLLGKNLPDEIVGDPMTAPEPVGDPVNSAAVFRELPLNGDSHPDYPSIAALIARVQKACNEDDVGAFLREVHTSRYLAVVRQLYRTELSDLKMQRKWATAARSLRDSVEEPREFEDYTIFRIEKLRENERLVWLHLHLHGRGTDPYRFWIIRSGDRWKLYDWEYLERGRSDAYFTAVEWGQEGEAAESLLKFREEVARFLNAVDEGSGSYLLAQTSLQRAEAIVVPRRLYGTTRMDLAGCWRYLDDDRSTLACLARAESWAPYTPGLFLIHGRILAKQKRYAEALEKFQAYNRHVGPTAEVLRAIFECQMSLGKEKEAIETARQLIRYEASDSAGSTFAISALQWSSEEVRSTAKDLLWRADGETCLLQAIVEALRENSWTAREARIVADLLVAERPDWIGTHIYQAAGYLFEGNRDDGLALLTQAVLECRKLDKSEAEQTRHAISLIGRRGEVLGPLYRETGEAWIAEEVFENCGDWDERSLVASVARQALKKNPDNVSTRQALGVVLTMEGDYEAALRYLEPWPQSESSVDDADYDSVRSEALQRLVTCYIRLGKWRKLRELAYTEPIAETIVDLVTTLRKPSDIRRLLPVVQGDDVAEQCIQLWLMVRSGESDWSTLDLDMLVDADGGIGSSARALVARAHHELGRLEQIRQNPATRPLTGGAAWILRRCQDWEGLLRLSRNAPPSPDFPREELPLRAVLSNREIYLRMLLGQRRWKEALEVASMRFPNLRGALTSKTVLEVIQVAVRKKRPDVIEVLARQVGDEDRPLVLAARALLRGDSDLLDESLSRVEHRRSDIWKIVESYQGDDEIVRKWKLRSAPRMELWPGNSSSVAFLLLEEPMKVRDCLDERFLRRIFGENAKIEFLDVSSEVNAVAAEVDGVFRVSLISGPSDPLPITGTGDPVLDEAMKRQKYLARLSVEGRPRENHPDEWHLRAVQIAHGLRDKGVLAVAMHGGWLRPDELTGDLDEVPTTLAVAIWRDVDEPPSFAGPSYDASQWLRIRQEVWQVFWDHHEAIERGKGPPLIVEVPTIRSAISETVRLRILARGERDSPWASNQEFLAEVVDDLKYSWIPRKGDIVRIRWRNIAAWEYGDQRGTIRRRPVKLAANK